MKINENMSSYKNPPEFNSVSKPYDRYIEELNAWCVVTDIAKSKQAVAIALSFPENDPSGIRDKVFNELKLESINRDNGVETLITYMNKLFKKDELAEVYERFTLFFRYTKDSNKKMEDFIMEYEKLYNRMVQKKLKLPESILAFKLLESSNLEFKDRQLVLTGVNYENKDTLFEQMKSAMKKFFGQQATSPSTSSRNESQIKVEPVLEVSDEHALYNSNYRPNPSRRLQPRGRGYFPSYNNNPVFGRSNATNQNTYQQANRKNFNPTGLNGKPLKCRVCESVLHLMRDCPHRNDNNIVLFTGNKTDSCLLMSESRNSAVLDSGCSSTVAGRTWIECFIQSLSDDEREKVERKSSNKSFKFGGGETKPSLEQVIFPCSMAGKDIFISTDVVDSDIPLLLSKNAMKQAGIKLDLEQDTANIWGNEIALECTTSGHYCVPLNVKNETVNECYFASSLPKSKILEKVHKQFAHPSKTKLKALLVDANVWDDEYSKLADDLYNSCEICKKFQITPPRPSVCLPIAKDFNDAVALDLKHWSNNKYILYMIDIFTRFTLACFIDDKKPDTIIDSIVKIWIGSGMGSPKRFIADNGGEFANSNFRDMCENLNIEILHTAAQSPWQNGTCERNHAIVDRCLEKIIYDNPAVSLPLALSWALNAKNALQMNSGFSPYQLVFGRNPNIPNNIVNMPPALEGSTINSQFACHMNTLQSARQAYVEAEASERVRRALRTKLRNYTKHFEQGAKVFYKREDSNQWKGPGKVIGQDGKVVLIRHGSIYVRVSPCRVLKFGDEFTENEVKEVENSDDTNVQRNYNPENINNQSNNSSDVESTDIENATSNIASTNTTYAVKIPEINQNFKYKILVDDEWTVAKILSRAGKASGSNKNWRNIENEHGEKYSIDFDKISQWELLEPETEPTEEVNVVIISKDRHNNSDVLAAKQRELDRWKQFNVYDAVPDEGQLHITTTWVVTEKVIDSQQTIKARLVARGFQEDFDQNVESPTVHKSTLKIAFAVAALKLWTCKTIDIKAAFLQGNNITRDVFLKPPKEASDNNKLWKLKKAVYGLNDAARQWFLSVKTVFDSLGCVQSKHDPALFSYYRDNTIIGILMLHVDDFIFIGTQEFHNTLISPICETFKVGKEEEKSFKYVGLNILHSNAGLKISQNDYISALNNDNVISSQRQNQKFHDLNDDELTLFRTIIGQLNWVSTQTRPDISFDSLNMSLLINKNPKVFQLTNAIKLINKLRTQNLEIFYPYIGTLENLQILVFTDASYANMADLTSSAGANIIFLKSDNRVCVLSWSATKIKRVVKSTTAAECLSLLDGLECAIYIRDIMVDVLKVSASSFPITAYIDNKNLYNTIHSTKLIQEKRLRIDIAIIQEMLQNNEIAFVKWIPSNLQLSDCLSKKGANCQKLMTILSTGNLDDFDQNAQDDYN